MRKMIDNVIDEMKKTAEQLWKCEENSYQTVKEYMAGWQQVLQEMLKQMCQWVENGEDIPLDVILYQLENFNTALVKKDDMQLADVLYFELQETLKYYKDLLVAYDGK